RVEAAAQPVAGLIDVHAGRRLQDAVEQQALLQRGERVDVFDVLHGGSGDQSSSSSRAESLRKLFSSRWTRGKSDGAGAASSPCRQRAIRSRNAAPNEAPSRSIVSRRCRFAL